jgi:acyl-coenzyme A thioesterase 13
MALSPISKPGFWFFMGGVTRTLNISYLRAIPIGTTVKVNSKVIQAGRTMALIQGEITSVDGKTVYCTCEHHKVHIEAQPHHIAAIEKMMEEEAAEKLKSGVKL